MRRALASACLLPAWFAFACVGEPEGLPVYAPGEPLAFRTSYALVEGDVLVEGGDFHQGDNVLLVSSRGDGSEKPALVAASAFMPAHSHGTEPPVLHRVDDVDRVDRLLLFMAGRWEITLEFEYDGQRDEFVFAADVP